MGSKDVIIDFNGYFKSADKFIIKEYATMIVDKIHKTIITESQVTKPRSHWLFANCVTRRNYRSCYLPTWGVKWNRGDEKVSDARKKVIERLKDADNIYVRNKRQKELLLNFIGGDENYQIVCCDDLGYNKAMVLSTLCKNHEESWKNNCAVDNVLDMYEWLKKTKSSRKPKNKIYSVMRHVVVDFVGYYIPVDQFVLKEFNALVIDDVENAFDNVRNKYFVTKQPYYFSKLPMELKDLPFEYQILYSSFHDTYGISWDAGNSDFRTYRQDLRSYFTRVVNIYVRNNENKRLLLDIIGHEYRERVVVLRKFGYNVQPKMETTCVYHDKGWKNNCAVDNSRSMVSWVIENRRKLNIAGLRVESK